MSGIKSNRKGKRGEREAAKYLRSLGFEAIRGQQRSGDEEADVVSDFLPRVFFEVKFGYPISTFDMHLKAFSDACKKARMQAEETGRDTWCILWKPKGQGQWRLTMGSMFGPITIASDDYIRGWIKLCKR